MLRPWDEASRWSIKSPKSGESTSLKFESFESRESSRTKDDMNVAVPTELQDIIAPVRAKYSGSGGLCSECYPEPLGVAGSGWM